MDCYVCNLNTRTDRWLKLQNMVSNKSYIKLHRIASDKDIIPLHGIIRSHLECLEKGVNNSRKNNFILFEDDVVLADDFREKCNDYYKNVPNDWDIILLGANNCFELSKINKNVFKVKGFVGSHAMMFNKTSANKIIPGLLQELSSEYPTFVDFIYSDLIKCLNLNVYLLYPILVKSCPEGTSDIRGGNIDDTLVQKYLDELLKKY